MDQAAWISDVFGSIDAMDSDRFVSFLADDATFRFGNAPEATGKRAIREAVDGFFSSIKGLRHHILKTWEHPDTVICQGEVTYTRLDGGEVTIPFVNIYGMRDGRIREYLVYIDLSPLYPPGR